jgi:hypothetical protein
VSCTVASEGYSTVYLTCNLGGKQEIGRYRRKVPLEKCVPLRDQIQRTGYEQLPKGKPVQPGTGHVALGERIGDAPPKIRAFATTALPKEILPFMEAMGPFIELVREEPNQVLAGSAKWVPASLPREAELVLQVTLTNPGVAPIQIQNFAAPEVEVAAMLHLSPNVPNAEVQSIELKKEHFRLLPKPGGTLPAKIPATLEILPGDQVLLEIRKRLLMSPGVYKGAIVLHSVQGKIDEARAVTGALSIEPGLLTITK